MRKYNLYMNEICNVHYLIAKFKFNPFKYSYVIFYDLSWLCAHLCIHLSVSCFFSLLCSTKNKVDEELYGEKQEKNGNAPFFFVHFAISHNSGKFNIHQHLEYGATKSDWKKSEQIFVRNHIIIYEVLRKDISFCSFIIYSSVLFFYPFSLLFSLLHTMPSHLMIVFLAPVFLFNAAVRLCNFVVIFIEFSEC